MCWKHLRNFNLNLCNIFVNHLWEIKTYVYKNYPKIFVFSRGKFTKLFEFWGHWLYEGDLNSKSINLFTKFFSFLALQHWFSSKWRMCVTIWRKEKQWALKVKRILVCLKIGEFASNPLFLIFSLSDMI